MLKTFEPVHIGMHGPQRSAKFLWFSGKGGTGKTTISSATALQLADRGHDVLLVSTDPAHSVADALAIEMDGKTAINDRLDVVEIDPEEEVQDYKETLQTREFEDQWGIMEEVYEGMDIMKGGPGVAEMAAFNRFMEFMNTDDYDVVVFDTAPTGHTLSLLRLPEVMESMVGKVLRMRMRFSQAVGTVKSIFGQEHSDGDVAKLEEMKRRIEHARAAMADPDVTSFNFVLEPETMSIDETRRAIDRVREFGIPVGRIFVNKLLPENDDCDFCASRRAMQQRNLEVAREAFTPYAVVHIPMQQHEVRGIDALNDLANHMTTTGTVN